MTSSPIWRLAPGQRLLHRCWDGECVLYNDLSGDTHLLDEFALALLQQVQAEPQPAALLAASFGVEAGSVPVPPGEELQSPAELLHEVLTELAALHLIDSTPC